MSRCLCLGIVFVLPLCALAQINNVSEVRLSGVIIDSLTRGPVPDVHISTAQRGTISDKDGTFSILVDEGGMLYFTHINYYGVSGMFLSTGVTMPVTILMVQRIRVLGEVTVRDLLSEEQMKNKILETDPILSTEQQHAMDNSGIINSLGKLAPPATPTREEIFFEEFTGPKDVTIFSSNPNKGLGKLIKSLRHPEKNEVSHPATKYKSDPLKVNPFRIRLHSEDTIKRDSTHIVREY